MTVTWYDQGIQQGIRQGMQQGRRELIRSMLEARFTSLSDEATARLAAWPAEHLDDLGKAILTARSLRELELES